MTHLIPNNLTYTKQEYAIVIIILPTFRLFADIANTHYDVSSFLFRFL